MHRVTSRSSFRHCLNRERRGDAPNWRWHGRYLCVIRNLRTNADWAEREEGKRVSRWFDVCIGKSRIWLERIRKRRNERRQFCREKRKNNIISSDRSNERCRCSWNHSEQSSIESIVLHRINTNAKNHPRKWLLEVLSYSLRFGRLFEDTIVTERISLLCNLGNRRQLFLFQSLRADAYVLFDTFLIGMSVSRYDSNSHSLHYQSTALRSP